MVAAGSLGVGIVFASNTQLGLALISFGGLCAIGVAGWYGRVYVLPWFLRRFFAPPSSGQTIGYTRQPLDFDRSPKADAIVTFRTSNRAPRLFPTGFGHRPARLVFQQPRGATITEKDLGITRIPVGHRGGYLVITKFTRFGFGVEEHGTDGDRVEIDVHY